MPVPYRSQQSPINFADAEVRSCDFPPDYAEPCWSTRLIATIDKKDHGTNYRFDNLPETIGLNLNGEFFHLAQLHFHVKGEHLLEGKNFEGELHIVHQIPAPPPTTDPSSGGPPRPSTEPEDVRYAVLGVWLVVGKGSQAMDSFVAEITRGLSAKSRTPEVADRTVDVPMDALLPPNPEEFYRYEGSLTTKHDDDNYESVKWLIYRHPLEVSRAALNGIKKIAHPAKTKQYVNRRFVLTSF